MDVVTLQPCLLHKYQNSHNKKAGSCLELNTDITEIGTPRSGHDGSNRNVQLNVSTEEGNIEMWQAIRKEIIEMKTNPSVCTVSVLYSDCTAGARWDVQQNCTGDGSQCPPSSEPSSTSDWRNFIRYFWLILQCSVTILWHDQYYQGKNSNRRLGLEFSIYWKFSLKANKPFKRESVRL